MKELLLLWDTDCLCIAFIFLCDGKLNLASMKIVVLLVSLGLNMTLQIKISTLSFNYFSSILLLLIFLSSEFIVDPKKPLKLDYEVIDLLHHRNGCHEVVMQSSNKKRVTECLFQCIHSNLECSNLTVELLWGFFLAEGQCKFTSV